MEDCGYEGDVANDCKTTTLLSRTNMVADNCYDRKRTLLQLLATLQPGFCAGIIKPAVVPFICQRHADLLQQDNARPHTGRQPQNGLRHHNILVLPWPVKSPDISPIEHCGTTWGVPCENVLTSTTCMTQNVRFRWNGGESQCRL